MLNDGQSFWREFEPLDPRQDIPLAEHRRLPSSSSAESPKQGPLRRNCCSLPVLQLLWSFGSVHLGVQKEPFGAFFIVYI